MSQVCKREISHLSDSFQTVWGDALANGATPIALASEAVRGLALPSSGWRCRWEMLGTWGTWGFWGLGQVSCHAFHSLSFPLYDT